jgi:RNA polymerase sigma-70 factor (ECF subfamily)
MLVAALRRGDESAFTSLVDRYHGSLVRLAHLHVSDRMMAEEIAQETWLALWKGIDRFEEHSSLKTWLCRVTLYACWRRLEREKKTVPFSEIDRPSVDSNRFDPPGSEWAGHWSEEVPSWDETPEERFLAGETLEHLKAQITTLPLRQRAVIVLRDIEGMTASEVCTMLKITDSVQRLLLHRARAHVRAGLDTYLRGEQQSA